METRVVRRLLEVFGALVQPGTQDGGQGTVEAAGKIVRVERAGSDRGTGVISYRMLSIKAAHMELIVVNI